MSRQNPLLSLEKGLVALGGWILYKLGAFTSKSEEYLEKTGFFKFVYNSVLEILTSCYDLVANFPQHLKSFFSNLLAFVYIFCILVVVGQFDWLLDDLYGLVALSAMLTYVSYR